MRIPTPGEGQWLLPEGPEVYWQGEITTLTSSMGDLTMTAGAEPRHSLPLVRR
jgi:hypothetical protein